LSFIFLNSISVEKTELNTNLIQNLKKNWVPREYHLFSFWIQIQFFLRHLYIYYTGLKIQSVFLTRVIAPTKFSESTFICQWKAPPFFLSKIFSSLVTKLYTSLLSGWLIAYLFLCSLESHSKWKDIREANASIEMWKRKRLVKERDDFTSRPSMGSDL